MLILFFSIKSLTPLTPHKLKIAARPKPTQPINKPFAAPKTKPKTLFSPLIAELLVVALSNNFESNKIASLIEQGKVKYIIDLHNLSYKRSQQINLGTNYGFNVVGNFTVLNRIIQIFENNGFVVTKDFPFVAPQNTIAGFFSKNYRVFSLQIEINSGICKTEDGINNLVDSLTEIVKSILAYEKTKKD